MELRIRRNETIENLIKRFGRKVKKAKIIEEYRDRQYYKKPSEKRRERHFRRLAEIEKQKRKERQQRED
jgi:small subunit ribosomal protein S21